MRFFEFCLLNQKNFDLVKDIEKQVYPSHMHSYQDFDDVNDLLDYSDCDGQMDCIIKNDWYAIFCNGATEVEIIDLASRRPLSIADINEVINKLKSFGDKIINMNARESTSYRLIKAFARRGLIDILQDEPNFAFGEPMHEIRMKVRTTNSFKEWYHIQEAIDAETERALVPFMAKFSPDQKQEVEKELQTLRNDPNPYQRGQVFSALQKFIQKKEKPVSQIDAFRKNWQDKGSTEEELKTYDFFKNEPKQSLQEMMELLRKFIDKKLITIKIENNKPVLMRNTLQGEQKLEAPDFTQFMSHLHGIESSLTQYSGKGNYFNPIEEELNHQPNLVAKGDNVWVFKGHAPDICRIYGKNQKWCISSSQSAANWFGYRINHHQTQYFVFDFNKDENDPARYVNPGVAPEGMYSEWVDANNQHSKDPEDPNSQVGINGYRSINEYKRYLASKGIPLDIWKTTEPEDWEKRLQEYQENKNFSRAKNDPDSRVFPMYVKIVEKMDDKDFNSLDDSQKTEFVMGKIFELTNMQFEYAKNVKGYYNSLKLGYDAISNAAGNGQLDIIKYLVKKGNFITPVAISDASYYGHLDVVKYLVEKRANIGSAVDNAALAGHLDVVKYLLGDEVELNGEKIKFPENFGKPKIEYAASNAAMNGHLDIIKYLVEKKEHIGNDVVGIAAGNGHLDIVKYLVEKGAYIGNALDAAALYGQLHVVKYLEKIS